MKYGQISFEPIVLYYKNIQNDFSLSCEEMGGLAQMVVWYEIYEASLCLCFLLTTENIKLSQMPVTKCYVTCGYTNFSFTYIQMFNIWTVVYF